MVIECPVCGKSQKVCNRECNECFRNLVEDTEGTIPKPERRFGFWIDDTENMSKGVFRCI